MTNLEKDGPMRVKKLMHALAALIGLASVPAMASNSPEAGKLSSGEIDQLLAAPRQGTALATVPMGPDGPKAVLLRRTKSGEPEVHEHLDDVFMIRSGRAKVLVGGTVAGNRQVSPGEWRGGTITGSDQFEVEAGDVLWIRAGLPHQVILPDGGKGDVSYVAFKYPR